MVKKFLIVIIPLLLWSAYSTAHAGFIIKGPSALGLSSGLVGYWTFDGADMAKTTAYDRSGQGNNGTLTNGPVRTNGKLGQALSFDGVDDVVDGGSASSIDNIFTGGGTISAWIYPMGFGPAGRARIVHKGSTNDPDDGFLFYISNAESNIPSLVLWSAFDLGSDGGWYTPAGSIALNRWHHVAVVYNDSSSSNNPIFYINNVSVGVTELASPAGGHVSDAAENLFIGNSSANDRDFDGIIDEVRIYDRMLSAEEIKQLYNIGR